MVSMTGISFPSKVLREQIASAIDVVIQLSRHEDGCRRLVSLQEINGMEGEIITMSELFRFEREGVGEDGAVMGRLQSTGIVPGFHKKLMARGIDLPIEVFSPEDLA
jgi:pilus assembly protein CpaF